MSALVDYAALLGQVKARIAGAQLRAALAANRARLTLYWEIGRMLAARQSAEGWGAAVIPRLAADLARELPDARGFSERNLKRMVQFYRAYPELLAAEEVCSSGPQAVAQIRPQPVAQITPQAVAQIRPQPVARVPDDPDAPALEIPWGHNILIKSRTHERAGAAVTNFSATLPAPQTDLASTLPTIEAIEAELSGPDATGDDA